MAPFPGKGGWSVNFNTHLHIVPNLRMRGAIHPLLHKPSGTGTNIEAHSLHDSELQRRWVCSCSLWWGSCYYMLHSKTDYCKCVKCVYHTSFTTDMFQPLSRSSKAFLLYMTHLHRKHKVHIYYIKQYIHPC